MHKKILIITLLLTVTVLFVSGCGLMDKMSAIKDDFQDANSGNVKDDQEDTETNELVLETQDLEEADDSVKTEEIGEIKKVLLYFSDKEGQNLVPTEQEVSKVEGLGRETVERLLEGPSSGEELVSALPLGTSLLDINIRDDKVCIADFSRDLITGLAESEISEKMAVYSIVNTLCQFESIEQVEIRVEGKKMDTLAGHLDISRAVMADPSLVKQ